MASRDDPFTLPLILSLQRLPLKTEGRGFWGFVSFNASFWSYKGIMGERFYSVSFYRRLDHVVGVETTAFNHFSNSRIHTEQVGDSDRPF